MREREIEREREGERVRESKGDLTESQTFDVFCPKLSVSN